jgi:hydrogenase-4 component B
MSVLLAIAALVACAVSGIPGLFCNRNTSTGQWIATILATAGCALGLLGVGVFWYAGDGAEVAFPWYLPGGEVRLGMDGLSAFFLVPIFLIGLLGSIYGLGYWKQTEHPENGRKLRLFYGILPAGMGLLVIARNGLVFLFGWEAMALAAFFLVRTEDEHQEVRETGWLYLLATHFSTLCLFALFALLRAVHGSFDLNLLTAEQVSPPVTVAVMILALLGFGLKAGVMPLHIWLPSSHAIAPSHVSAIMSGVIIKMGIYGLVRMTSLLPSLSWEWGAVILGLGAVSGVLGVAYAIGQHDLKRLLAYHSIENIGIIVMGLGLAMLGRSLARADWVILGLGGALLHVWNHAFFKSLLFLSAGSVIHATHTREIDHLGGLAKRMPRTALCFLVGAVAICGLPPLNGFVSEFFIYLGLFRTLGIGEGATVIGAAFAVPILALIGALALACFVKVFGAVFLGEPRSPHAVQAHESGPSMFGPMLVLVAVCFFIGLIPASVAPVLTEATHVWAPELHVSRTQLTSLAPMEWISVVGVILLGVTALIGLAFWRQLHRSSVSTGPTWGCGYAAPTPRMQYTSSSFAQMLVGLFSWALRPKRQRPKHLQLFPQQSVFHSEVNDVVLEEGLRPAFHAGAHALSWFRVLQQGKIQAYLLYIFLTLLVLLLWR